MVKEKFIFNCCPEASSSPSYSFQFLNFLHISLLPLKRNRIEFDKKKGTEKFFLNLIQLTFPHRANEQNERTKVKRNVLNVRGKSLLIWWQTGKASSLRKRTYRFRSVIFFQPRVILIHHHSFERLRAECGRWGSWGKWGKWSKDHIS